MTSDERAPYEAKAKEMKANPNTTSHNRPVRVERDILTCHGIPYSQIQKERQELELKETKMKTRIRDLIDNGFLQNSKYINCSFLNSNSIK